MLKATQDAPLSPSKNKSSLKASNGPTINLGQFFNSQAAAPMDTSLEVTTVSAAKKRPPSVQTQSSYPQKTSKMEVDHPNKSNPEGACPMETSAKEHQPIDEAAFDKSNPNYLFNKRPSINQQKPIFIDFGQVSFINKKQPLDQRIEELEKRTAEKLRLVHIDCDTHEALSTEYFIRSGKGPKW